MLEVQKYLRSGKTLDELEKEFGIINALHPEDALVILNYSITGSQKTHPIVRECRALVLEVDTWNLVAKPFNRFFNWGEVADEMQYFDWSDFVSYTKEDGSLILVYNYKDEWRINSRGSFGDSKVGDTNKTWRDFALEILDEEKFSRMNKKTTYVFEFVSPHNKIVRSYDKSDLVLLSAFIVDNDIYIEIDYKKLDRHAEEVGLSRVGKHSFKSLKEIEDYLKKLEEKDPTNEGIVICDKLGHRWKLKNRRYLALHQMWGAGGANPKHILPFVLGDEGDELLTYFPEFKKEYYDIKDKVDKHFDELKELWNETWQIEDQKEFALSVTSSTRFSGILFSIRKKYGDQQNEKVLREAWNDSEEIIFKKLFK